MSQESTAPKQKVRREQHPLWNWVGFLPFFLFIFLFLVLPSLNLFTGAFTNREGQFTLENLNILSNPFTRKSYIVSLQVSAITALVGGLFGFFVAYSITHGGALVALHRVLRELRAEVRSHPSDGVDAVDRYARTRPHRTPCAGRDALA